MRSATSRSSSGVTVVVVTHQSADVVGDCLRALPAALEGAGPAEIIVADNLSTDGTPAVAAVALTGVPDARVLALDTNHGYAAGVNAALATARPSAAVLVLNPDVRLQPGSIAVLERALAEPGTGATVPRIIDGSGSLQWSLRREPTTRRALAEAVLGGTIAARLGTVGEVIRDPSVYARDATADWATGAAMLISRTCIDDIGPLDESFFLYSEETDFMLRARDAGYATRYVTEAVAVHLGGEMETSPWLWAMRSVNRVRLQRRRHGRASTAAFLLASLLGEGLRALAGRATSRQAFTTLLRQGLGIVARPPAPARPAPPGWICFSAQDWWYHNRAHSDFQLMQGVAARRPVLLVNSIGLRVPLPGRSTGSSRRIARKLGSILHAVRRPVAELPGYHVVTPISLPRYSTERARRVNARLVSTQVALVARWLGLVGDDRPEPVVMVTIPTALDAARTLPSSSLVVNRSDMHSGFPEADGEAIRRVEVECLAAADKVFYTAQSLLDTEQEHTDDRAFFLDHGVDVEHFRRRSPADEPADLAAIPHPRVGFFGSLDDYLVDFDLLEAVGAGIPEAQLVLIGDATCSMRRFDRYPNVHHLGFRPYAAIPAYGTGFDVALMPWLDNEWIRHSNPIKMKEYLALGLAVVSTDFPEVHRYSSWIRIASDRDTFVEAVRRTLHDGGLSSPAARRAAVIDATWTACATRLLHEAEGARPDPPVPAPLSAGAGTGRSPSARRLVEAAIPAIPALEGGH